MQDTPCSFDTSDTALLSAAVIDSCHALMHAAGFGCCSALAGMYKQSASCLQVSSASGLLYCLSLTPPIRQSSSSDHMGATPLVFPTASCTSDTRWYVGCKPAPSPTKCVGVPTTWQGLPGGPASALPVAVAGADPAVAGGIPAVAGAEVSCSCCLGSCSNICSSTAD